MYGWGGLFLAGCCWFFGFEGWGAWAWLIFYFLLALVAARAHVELIYFYDQLFGLLAWHLFVIVLC